MITHIRIQNLRSLVDTGFIEIKPLTILLGANSSGKSTFLRSFPLFTQSVSKSLREPISWFDDAYVDFGDYDTAKSRMAKEGEGIMFSYKFVDLSPIFYDNRYYSRFGGDMEHLVASEFCDSCTLELSFQKDSKGTFVNKVIIVKDSLTLEFNISDRNSNVSIIVNDVVVLNEEKWRWKYGTIRTLLPEFDVQLSQDDSNVRKFEEIIEKCAYDYIHRFCSNKLKRNEKIYKIMRHWCVDKEKFLKTLQEKATTNTFKQNIKDWSIDNGDFLYLYNILAVMNALSCFTTFDHELRSFYGDCSYIAPVRAAANRYYRTQGLQVRDVDPYGKNLQEFILSLNGNRERSYREFTEHVLGLTVKVKNKAGHQQIVLSKDGKEVNLADVGFGYSQILPIITKFWLSISTAKDSSALRGRYRMYESMQVLTTIEQPELHLHPAMQARTIDVMMLTLNEMKRIKEQKKEELEKHGKEYFFWEEPISLYTPSMLVETHSQTMINRIGRRIRDKQFSADDVSILMFEKDENTGVTNIRKIEFNDKGQLIDWPFGFFDPREDEYDTLFN